jgi:hypothetical protein
MVSKFFIYVVRWTPAPIPINTFFLQIFCHFVVALIFLNLKKLYLSNEKKCLNMVLFYFTFKSYISIYIQTFTITLISRVGYRQDTNLMLKVYKVED